MFNLIVQRNSIGTIWNPANICCVQFSAYSSHLLSFGSADYRICCYDLRHTKIPWCTLAGHDNAVSYVKFLDAETLVSASTDNTLKLWDLKKTSLEGLSPNACSLTFSGHTNEKVNFEPFWLFFFFFFRIIFFGLSLTVLSLTYLCRILLDLQCWMDI